MLGNCCQVLGGIYDRGVDFDGGIVRILWPRSWQKCGPYVMLAKITRPRHVYNDISTRPQHIINVFKGLKGSYRHIRHILFHRINKFFHTFIILFHRYVENSNIFFNTFLIVFYCFLALFGYISNKKERVTTPSLYHPTNHFMSIICYITESLSLLNRGKLLPRYVLLNQNLCLSYCSSFHPFL